MPGWKHMLDLLLRRAMWLMPTTPLFIKRVKALTGFLRQDAELVALHLRKKGMRGLASLLLSEAVPNFAHWRWSTLDNVLRVLSKFYASLSLGFDGSAR